MMALRWAGAGLFSVWLLAQPLLAADRIVVVPFDNANQSRPASWLGEGSAILVAQGLAKLGAGVVDRGERLRVYERLQLPPQAPLSHAMLVKVGDLIHAGYVVVGSFALTEGQLQVKARAVELDEGRMLPEVGEAGPVADLLLIYARIAARISQAVGGAAVPAPALDPVAPPAFESYVKGLMSSNAAHAVVLFSQALRADPTFQPARLQLGRIYLNEGEFAKAEVALAAVPADAPEWAEARFYRGLAELGARKYDAAFKTLNDLLASRQDAPIHNALGIVQLRRSREPGGRSSADESRSGHASWYFSKAAAADPDDPDYYFNLGYALWIEKDPPAAAYWLREAVRRAPSDGDAHYLLNVALREQGTITEANQERELAVRLSSRYTQWEHRAGAAPGELVPRGLERLTTDLGATRARRAEAEIAQTEKKSQGEVAAFHLERGRRLLADGRPAEAEDELRRALYLSPYLVDAHVLLGRAALKLGRPEQTVDELKTALENRETADLHVLLGEAYLVLGKREEARAEVARALTLEPASAEAAELARKLETPPDSPQSSVSVHSRRPGSSVLAVGSTQSSGIGTPVGRQRHPLAAGS